MDITIRIPAKIIRTVAREVKELTGRDPTQQQLEQFFRKDIRFMYSAAFEDGLLDGILVDSYPVWAYNIHIL